MLATPSKNVGNDNEWAESSSCNSLPSSSDGVLIKGWKSLEEHSVLQTPKLCTEVSHCMCQGLVDSNGRVMFDESENPWTSINVSTY